MHSRGFVLIPQLLRKKSQLFKSGRMRPSLRISASLKPNHFWYFLLGQTKYFCFSCIFLLSTNSFRLLLVHQESKQLALAETSVKN